MNLSRRPSKRHTRVPEYKAYYNQAAGCYQNPLPSAGPGKGPVVGVPGLYWAKSLKKNVAHRLKLQLGRSRRLSAFSRRFLCIGGILQLAPLLVFKIVGKVLAQGGVDGLETVLLAITLEIWPSVRAIDALDHVDCLLAV